MNSFFRIAGRDKKSFTLIELLVVLALVAILSVVVILTLNPAELIKQARDSNRLSDLSTINTALNLFSADVTSGFMGTSTVVYVSIPSASPTCVGLGLPTLPSTYTYNCVTSASLRNTDGSGWIPVNFQRISSNSPISQLPIDPINTTSTRLYYTYVSGGSWELNATVEASKNKLGGSGDLTSKDGGSALSQYETGNNLNLSPVETGDVSLVGYWNFEEGSGATVLDRSGSGNDGVWYGTGSHYASGKAGSYAGRFNGSDDYNDLGSKSTFNMGGKKFTISAWINTNDSSGYKGIFGLMHGAYSAASYSLYLYADYYEFGVSSGVNASGVQLYPVGLNQWHNLVGVFDSNNLTFYIDGVQLAPVSWVGGDVNSLTQLYMGRISPGAGGGYFSGSIDDIRLYSRALSSVEVSALYNAAR